MIKRKKDRFYGMIFIICVLLLAYFTIAETNLFFMIQQFFADPRYRWIWGADTGRAPGPISFFDMVIGTLTEYHWALDDMLIYAPMYFQLLLPIFATLAGLRFYGYLQSTFSLEVYRTEERLQKTIWKKALQEALSLGKAMYGAYLLLFVVALFLSKGQVQAGYSRSFLGSLSETLLYIYYPIEGFVRLFFMPFIYTIFVCAIGLVARNRKVVLLSTNMYYFGMVVIFYALEEQLGMLSYYFNPSSAMIIGSTDDLNHFFLLLCASIPFWIGASIIRWRGKHVEL